MLIPDEESSSAEESSDSESGSDEESDFASGESEAESEAEEVAAVPAAASDDESLSTPKISSPIKKMKNKVELSDLEVDKESEKDR